MFAILCALAMTRPSSADERARLQAVLDNPDASSSPTRLAALGEEATSYGDADTRIAAWLFAAEGLAERTQRPREGGVYARRALAEPSIGPVDRGRAVAVLVASHRAGGDLDAAIALADREATVVPGLAPRLRGERRAERVLTTSRWVLALVGAVGALGLAARIVRDRGDQARGRALRARIFDGPVWLGALVIAMVAPLLARAFDPAVDTAPFARVALGMLLVHVAIAPFRETLQPALRASLALGAFLFVAAWAYLGSARPLPAWAAP